MEYLIVKWLHILSSTIIFGTGLGSAFLMFLANRRKHVSEIYFAARHVVIADWIFTAPAIVFQLISGLYLAHSAGYSLDEVWLMTALGLFVFAGLCWLLVVRMQIKMRDLAEIAMANGGELPARYWLYDRWWIFLGCLAFPAVTGIFWLMVAKPG
jgi:uncharacterized membrane protein